MIVQVRVLDSRVFDFGIPAFQSEGAAAVDLRAMLDFNQVLVGPHETIVLNTGVAFWINDPNYVGQVHVRSSVGAKQGLVLANGTGIIDSDYQGECFVALRNVTDQPKAVLHGERIAQFMILPVIRPEFQVVEEFEANTVRGAGGLGSTGRL